MKSQAHAVLGRGLAEQVECGCVTSPENTDSSPATQPRPKRRNAYRDAAVEILLTLRQRFPQCFARLDEKQRRPLKVGIHVDIQTAMPDIDKIALSRALRFYVSDLRYHRAVTEGAKRIDLDGNAAGTVTAAEAENSKRSLAGIEAKLARQREYHTARRAKPKPATTPEKPKQLGLADLKAAAALRKLSVREA